MFTVSVGAAAGARAGSEDRGRDSDIPDMTCSLLGASEYAGATKAEATRARSKTAARRIK
jgi:hypothetical protein